MTVAASFALFAVDQVSSASTHQQEELNAEAAAKNVGTGTVAGAGSATGTGTAPAPGAPAPHASAVHKVIDTVSSDLTSPFSGISGGSGSQWATRGVDLLLALVVYGFGLGYLARVLRVRSRTGVLAHSATAPTALVVDVHPRPGTHPPID